MSKGVLGVVYKIFNCIAYKKCIRVMKLVVVSNFVSALNDVFDDFQLVVLFY